MSTDFFLFVIEIMVIVDIIKRVIKTIINDIIQKRTVKEKEFWERY
jgi:hypothetical protein